MVGILFLWVIICSSTVRECRGFKVADPEEANESLVAYNKQTLWYHKKYQESIWRLSVDSTKKNRQNMLNAKLELAVFKQMASVPFTLYDTTDFPELMKREIKKILNIGIAAETDDAKMKRLGDLKAELQLAYHKGLVCDPGNPAVCENLHPDSKDSKELQRRWIEWRERMKTMKEVYVEMVFRSNEALDSAGYGDMGEYWRSFYEDDRFKDQLEKAWKQIKPLYEQLHAFIRKKLKKQYGADKFPETGHVPAHLFGDLHGVGLTNLEHFLLPFKGKDIMSGITKEMKKQKYTALNIFERAHQFYINNGMTKKIPQRVWHQSFLKKPKVPQNFNCAPLALDLLNGADFRVKMCTDVTHGDLIKAHRQLAHIIYFMEYKNQLMAFREGANPAFHEALAGAMSLSVETEEYMHAIGLLKKIKNDKESEINFLMKKALETAIVLPYAYLTDKWRWDVFRGHTKHKDYTGHWWNLRCRYQGMSPPVNRTSNDFDPGSDWHVASNIPYIKDFVAILLQFQFHKALCDIAGHEGPLHRCTINKNKTAGLRLKAMLQLGSTKPGPKALHLLTSNETMSGEQMMEYFKPLYDFLKQKNCDDTVGWSDYHCPKNYLQKGAEALSGQNSVFASFALIAFAALLILMYNSAFGNFAKRLP